MDELNGMWYFQDRLCYQTGLMVETMASAGYILENDDAFGRGGDGLSGSFKDSGNGGGSYGTGTMAVAIPGLAAAAAETTIYTMEETK